jgi:hypothetical protein
VPDEPAVDVDAEIDPALGELALPLDPLAQPVLRLGPARPRDVRRTLLPDQMQLVGANRAQRDELGSRHAQKYRVGTLQAWPNARVSSG